jgi:hypothetical protein
MLHKILTCIALASLIMVVFTGCSAVRIAGTGKIVEKTYDFKDFTGVEISNAIKYEITRADSFSVSVSTPEDLVDRLDVYQKGSIVYIGMKFGLFTSTGTRAALTLPQLQHLSISGSSDGKATGFDSANELQINVSGASSLDADLQAGPVNMSVSGSSDISGRLTAANTQINLSGASSLDMQLATADADIRAEGSSDIRGSLQARNVDFGLSGASTIEINGSAAGTTIKASGASDMTCPQLSLQNVDVELSGASSASIQTGGQLNIDLSGSSDLTYTGNPTIGKIDVSGSSEVNHQ